MSPLQIGELRVEAEQMFYHGYDNYMKHAFPEDELRPLSCAPLTRDRNNPSHIELNDALGNYSLTLIDSLSTLAIMSSQDKSSKRKKNKAWEEFQDGVRAIVELYGDGTSGTKGVGERAKGFDIDSKVQVFETVIRGVGGLLSAHLFAVGELPIVGYESKRLTKRDDAGYTIKWSKGFKYNGQLLRLAENLGRRLLPAFVTSTGIPYPRVNLRHGVPFYLNSPLNEDPEGGECPVKPSSPTEITETCSAGAGSIVLEFTVLSRLTGDPIFEQVAKRAFWSVWERRSSIGLVGSGIDAESGHWTSPYTGIGAGIDSFYEYAAKASVLLSNLHDFEGLRHSSSNETAPSNRTQLVDGYQHTAAAFGEAWEKSHAAIKRHLYRGEEYTHPHYIQGDLFTGAARAYWVDSLSAFYPGLLAMFGEVEEAVEAHLLYTAVWTRFSAFPERWSLANGGVESGLSWWGGRPEFIESTYHIYQATKDPWYLHVGEMALRDIKRRCWTKCGFSGIQNVLNGDRSDRMESFFLGETTKYLYLLYTPDHPLNKLDAPFVFTTEGHPLIVPRSSQVVAAASNSREPNTAGQEPFVIEEKSCPKAPSLVPFSISATAARNDVFHAAKLARLHLMPTRDTVDSPLVEYSSDHPSITVSDVRSPSNFSYFPWTLPLDYVPHNGISSKINLRNTFDITFPALPNTIVGPGTIQRVVNGLLVSSLSGLRLGMIQDVQAPPDSDVQIEHYRIQSVNNIMLGRDEQVFLPKSTISQAVSPTDPNFTTIRDSMLLDLVIDLPPATGDQRKNFTTTSTSSANPSKSLSTAITSGPSLVFDVANPSNEAASSVRQAFSIILSQIGLILQPNIDAPLPTHSTPSTPTPTIHRSHIAAILPIGPGAAPLPDFAEAQYQSPDSTRNPDEDIIFNTIYMADDACTPLAAHAPVENQVIVIKRGTCSFRKKLANIATFAPAKESLQLVVVVSYDEGEFGSESDRQDGAGLHFLTRPALDDEQITSKGLPRRNPIPMVLVTGGEQTYEMLKRAKGLGLKRKYEIRAQGVPIRNLVIL